MNEAFTVVIRGAISLVALFLITKLLGKKQVSQLTLFDYVIGISIGNFAAEITINLEAKLIYGLISVVEFGLIAYLISILTMKSMVLRRFFMGTPTVLIEKGKILEDSLKRVHFDINDMLEECRTNGYFDISQIDYALMECNGELSILPKDKYRPANIDDLGLKQKTQGLCANVIIDGKIIPNNLRNMHKDVNWLNNELKVKGYILDDILLATLDVNDKLVVYSRNKNKRGTNVLE